MPLKELLKREAYVAMHAQAWKFRTVKYLVLFTVAALLWQWKGWSLVLQVFAVLLVLALVVHFVFRWKSKGWTQSWGPYKKMELPK